MPRGCRAKECVLWAMETLDLFFETSTSKMKYDCPK